jgi:pimeloyl-ACP methyl ester carboxylesterase
MAGKVVGGLVVAVLVLAASAAAFFYLRPLDVLAWAGRRALAKGGFARVSWETPAGTQRGWKAGSGPLLVLLHGAGDQSGSWSSVAPALLEGKGRTVLVLDLAGHGGSEPRRGPISVTTVVDALDAILAEELAAGAPAGGATLVGNSLGAWVAFLEADRRPERVARIVAVNGGPLKGSATPVSLLPKDREEARRTVAALRDAGSLKTPDFVLDDVARQARTGPLARLAETSAGMEALTLDGRLGALKTPVALVWGESDRLMPLDYARRMTAELPKDPPVPLVTIPRCGHVPQVECPAELVKALEGVLGRGARAQAPP